MKNPSLLHSRCTFSKVTVGGNGRRSRVNVLDKAWCLKSCKRSGGFSDGDSEHSRNGISSSSSSSSITTLQVEGNVHVNSCW